MKMTIGEANVTEGLGCSADSFYGSEGRKDPNFRDDNSTLIDRICEMYPECENLEMESHTLMALAALSKKDKIYAGSAAIGLIDRKNAN